MLIALGMSANFKLAQAQPDCLVGTVRTLYTWNLREEKMQTCMHLNKVGKAYVRSAKGTPVKVVYLSVDLAYRSAFPLVRVELYPN